MIINILLYLISHKYNKYILKKVHNQLYILLNKLTYILNTLNIEYFITGGTLLGACRDQSIIDFDDDIDIGLLEHNFTKLLGTKQFYELLTKNELVLQMSGQKLAHRIYFNKIIKYNVFIDIFEYQKQFNTTFTDSKFILLDDRQRTLWGEDFVYENELYPLREYKLGNLIVSGFNNPYPYLERNYGIWQFPVYTHTHIDQIIIQWNWYDYLLVYYYKYISILLHRLNIFTT